jgi:hypothetical protein
MNGAVAVGPSTHGEWRPLDLHSHHIPLAIYPLGRTDAATPAPPSVYISVKHSGSCLIDS